MSPRDAIIEPEFSTAERDEIAHLDYFLDRLAELFGRGLIGPEAHASVVDESQTRRRAIERAGQYAACVRRARSLAVMHPADAIDWAEHAAQIDPARPEAWRLMINFDWDRELDQAAIECCAEAPSIARS